MPAAVNKTNVCNKNASPHLPANTILLIHEFSDKGGHGMPCPYTLCRDCNTARGYDPKILTISQCSPSFAKAFAIL